MKKFNAGNEWSQFLEVWQKGNQKDSLNFAKKMIDSDNKKTAIKFLAPTAKQKAAAAKQRRLLSSDKSIHSEIEKMASSAGFMSNSPF